MCSKSKPLEKVGHEACLSAQPCVRSAVTFDLLLQLHEAIDKRLHVEVSEVSG